MAFRITIALASYQGARFLREQLDSIAGQDHRNWNLLVSDDGSDDGTREIAESFLREGHGTGGRIIDGPKAGATHNFLALAQKADPDGWLAFSDQDDVWLPDKLSRAAAFLSAQSGPAIYAARTTICDEDLNVLSPAPAFMRPLTFRNALIQACLPGNTIVANSAALRLMQAAAPAAAAADVISHDWWAYQLLSGAGAAIRRDTAQVLLYRQHPENVMGRNDTAKAKAARLGMLTDGRYADWLARNQRALEGAEHLLTPENRILLRRFGKMLTQAGPAAMIEFLRMGLYRQSRPGTLAVWGTTALGRLRPRTSAKLG
ncbi:glycosyltransferase [Paracoccus aminophilus]|uniref:Glycosyl transferase n=1 Tax=Paracoccus aminophilus JCM 7686 TaxID=1367847 RepID=S5YF93_PARAH|nr:glycosyltransferase [Paracoccus aminophilus]AGT10133.1 glycosyl transferase [Paracoccus aminophilus JCM 7686]